MQTPRTITVAEYSKKYNLNRGKIYYHMKRGHLKWIKASGQSTRVWDMPLPKRYQKSGRKQKKPTTITAQEGQRSITLQITALDSKTAQIKVIS